MVGRCKITVLRRTYYADLVEQFHKKPDLGPCDWFTDGAVYYTGGRRGNEMPEGFCPMAWQAILPIATTLAWGGLAFGFETTNIACCNDGLRPVIFSLEAVPDTGEQTPR